MEDTLRSAFASQTKLVRFPIPRAPMIINNTCQKKNLHDEHPLGFGEIANDSYKLQAD